MKFIEKPGASKTRPLFCTNLVATRMDFAVGRLYVSHYFDSNAKKNAIDMVNNIKEEFKIMFNDYDWIDEISRNAALEKVIL